jgi:AraC-like DNA-binding protein
MPRPPEPRPRIDDRLGRERPIFLLRHTPCARSTPKRAVTHDYVALTFYTGGSAVIEQQSRWTLTEGDVLLVPAGEPHRLIRENAPTGWSLGLCPVCFVAEGASELLEPFDRVRQGGAAVASIPVERRPFLVSLFTELEMELERPIRSPSVQRSLVTLVLAEVSRAAAWSGSEAERDIASEALRFIERRCLEAISARDVAKAVHRSPAHLTTVLRRATGRSVQEWIIAGRMSEARRRLLHTDERVEIIAERVGYADATHFIRLFRRMHGSTPSAWRAAQRVVKGAPQPPARS